MSSVWLLVRLAFATGVVLAPGLAARPRPRRAAVAAATLAWSLALVFAAGAVTFALEASILLTLVLVLGGRRGGAPVRAETAR